MLADLFCHFFDMFYILTLKMTLRLKIQGGVHPQIFLHSITNRSGMDYLPLTRDASNSMIFHVGRSFLSLFNTFYTLTLK